jgi:DNA-binding NarL/FixJ family response regulator
MPLKTLLIYDDARQTGIGPIQEMIAGEQSLTLVDTIFSQGAEKVVQNLQPELVWIHLDGHPVRGLALLAGLKRDCPEVSVLISCRNSEPEITRAAFRLGASDFLDPTSWSTELTSSVQAIELARSKPRNSPNTAAGATNAKAQAITTVLVCDADKIKREGIESLISGRKRLRLSATVSTANAAEKIRTLNARIIWLELAPAPENALALLAELKEKFPRAAVLVSYDKLDVPLMRAAHRLGASDFLDPSRWTIDLVAAIKRIEPGPKQPSVVQFIVVALAALMAGIWWLFHH